MKSISDLIYESYEKNKEGPRPHLGCSLLGDRCDRRMYLNFRNVVDPNFPGRILKLFKFGHDYEDTAIQELKAIGCRINSRQTRVDFGSHISGSCDGIIESGLPGYENERLLLEIKTHGERSFKELMKKGMVISKPMHHVQMVCYLYGLKLQRGLYYAVNKNTSEIHTEIVEADSELAKKMIERGKKIALSDYMPEPLSADPSWYECAMCSYRDFCHYTKMTDNAGCRTCAHSTPTKDSAWTCAVHENQEIPFEFQIAGCSAHTLSPEVVPWNRAESDNAHEAVYIIDGQPVRNGEPCERVYSSAEIIADPNACAHADETTEALRDTFDARLVSVNDADPTF